MNGVLFGDKHSFTEWGLYLVERPTISPPTPKVVYVNVSGANGTLDLTEVLSDDVKYEDRQITFKFMVLNKREKWSDIYSNIMDYLQGQKMKIILDEDKAYYYEGRCAVNSWESSKVHSIIVINAIVEPYKNERFSSLEPWEWDVFNFETGIVRDYRDIVVDGMKELEIEGTRKPIVPTFIVKGEMKVEFNGREYQLPLGNTRILNIVIKEGKNVLTFKGNGTVSVDYRGGKL